MERTTEGRGWRRTGVCCSLEACYLRNQATVDDCGLRIPGVVQLLDAQVGARFAQLNERAVACAGTDDFETKKLQQNSKRDVECCKYGGVSAWKIGAQGFDLVGKSAVSGVFQNLAVDVGQSPTGEVGFLEVGVLPEAGFKSVPQMAWSLLS